MLGNVNQLALISDSERSLHKNVVNWRELHNNVVNGRELVPQEVILSGVLLLFLHL